jgi:hypothetical protein
LYVLPGFEGQGLGTLLLQQAHVSVKRPIRLFVIVRLRPSLTASLLGV